MASPEAEMPLTLLAGQVTRVVDPSNFWLRCGSDADLANFKKFEESMNPAYLRLPTAGRTEDIVENTFILVQCSPCADGSSGSSVRVNSALQWRRATVMNIFRAQDTKFDVYYMDYGITEIVPPSRVSVEVPDFVKNQPVLWLNRCSLAGIRPIAKSWTTRGVKTFEKLTADKVVGVVILSIDQSAIGSLGFRVALYSRDEEERSIAHQLLEAETGLPTEEEVVEFAKDVQVTQSQYYGEWDCQMYEEQSDGTTTDTCESSEQRHLAGSSSATVSDASSLGDLALEPSSSKTSAAPSSNSQSIVNHSTTADEDQDDDDDYDDDFDDDDDDDDEDVATPSPTSVVVPGFNLSSLQQRSLLSAEELRKEKNASVQAERKAKLQQDLLDCHQDTEETMHMLGVSGQKWGKSDLLISRQLSLEDEEDIIDKSALVKTSLYAQTASGREFKSPVAGLKLEGEIKVLTNSARVSHKYVEGSPSGLNSNSSSGEQKQVPVVVTTPEQQQKEEWPPLLGWSIEATKEPPKRVLSSSPPPSSLTPEQREYCLQKKFKSILKDAVDGDEEDVTVCKFHSLVPHDYDNADSNMKLLLESLLEEATKHGEFVEIALRILDSYADVMSSEDLHEALKINCENYVKLPVGKMPGLHTQFSTVLVRLLQRASGWRALLRVTVEDFCLHCLERWIIFNKKGTQTGLRHHHVEKMYVDCAEIVLPACVQALPKSSSDGLQFIADQLREKVLETEVEYSVRARLLTLLLKMSQHTGEGSECESPPLTKPDTRTYAVQCDGESGSDFHATQRLAESSSSEKPGSPSSKNLTGSPEFKNSTESSKNLPPAFMSSTGSLASKEKSTESPSSKNSTGSPSSKKSGSSASKNSAESPASKKSSRSPSSKKSAGSSSKNSSRSPSSRKSGSPSTKNSTESPSSKSSTGSLASKEKSLESSSRGSSLSTNKSSSSPSPSSSQDASVRARSGGELLHSASQTDTGSIGNALKNVTTLTKGLGEGDIVRKASAESTDALPTGRGKSRRKQVVLEHLQKTATHPSPKRSSDAESASSVCFDATSQPNTPAKYKTSLETENSCCECYDSTPQPSPAPAMYTPPSTESDISSMCTSPSQSHRPLQTVETHSQGSSVLFTKSHASGDKTSVGDNPNHLADAQFPNKIAARGTKDWLASPQAQDWFAMTSLPDTDTAPGNEHDMNDVRVTAESKDLLAPKERKKLSDKDRTGHPDEDRKESTVKSVDKDQRNAVAKSPKSPKSAQKQPAKRSSLPEAACDDDGTVAKSPTEKSAQKKRAKSNSLPDAEDDGTDVDTTLVGSSSCSPSNKSFLSAVTSISQSAWNSIFGTPLSKVSFGPKTPETAGKSFDKSKFETSDLSSANYDLMSSSVDGSPKKSVLQPDNGKEHSASHVSSLTDVVKKNMAGLLPTDGDNKAASSAPETTAHCEPDVETVSSRLTAFRLESNLSQQRGEAEDDVPEDWEELASVYMDSSLPELECCDVLPGNENSNNNNKEKRTTSKKNTASDNEKECSARVVREKEFPALRQAERSDTPPPLTQLSLQSIAAGILHCPLDTACGDSGQNFSKDDDDDDYCQEAGASARLPHKIRQTVLQYSSAVQEEEAAVDVYYSDDDNDNPTVPSCWEDRHSPFPEEFGSEQWHYQSLNNDFQEDERSYRPPYSLDGSGDAVGTAFSKDAVGTAFSRDATVFSRDATAFSRDATAFSRDAVGTAFSRDATAFSRDAVGAAFSKNAVGAAFSISHSVKTSSSPVQTSYLAAKDNSTASRFSPNQKESSPDYNKRGDLGFMAKERSKGKKRIKFLPFDGGMAPNPRPEPREPWVPDVRCTNCAATDHLRKDCPNPQKHILFGTSEDYDCW